MHAGVHNVGRMEKHRTSSFVQRPSLELPLGSGDEASNNTFPVLCRHRRRVINNLVHSRDVATFLVDNHMLRPPTCLLHRLLSGHDTALFEVAVIDVVF